MVANGVVMSKALYLITVRGGAQQYLLKGLQVQQLTAARTVCGFLSRGWSKKKLLDKLDWLSIRQLIYYLHQSISTQHPYRTRMPAIGVIRFGETFHGDSSLIHASLKHRAVHWYNAVPVSVRTGSLETVKHELKKWIRQNVAIDWDFLGQNQLVAIFFLSSSIHPSLYS